MSIKSVFLSGRGNLYRPKGRTPALKIPVGIRNFIRLICTFLELKCNQKFDPNLTLSVNVFGCRNQVQCPSYFYMRADVSPHNSALANAGCWKKRVEVLHLLPIVVSYSFPRCHQQRCIASMGIVIFDIERHLQKSCVMLIGLCGPCVGQGCSYHNDFFLFFFANFTISITCHGYCFFFFPLKLSGFFLENKSGQYQIFFSNIYFKMLFYGKINQHVRRLESPIGV